MVRNIVPEPFASVLLHSSTCRLRESRPDVIRRNGPAIWPGDYDPLKVLCAPKWWRRKPRRAIRHTIRLRECDSPATAPYFIDAAFPNTASMPAWADLSPSPLDTPMLPTT